MGLLDELLKDAERFTASGTANIDHVVATVNRVLNARFADVLRGRRIQVRPVLDRHQHIWRLEAELSIAIPFSLAVTEEVLDRGTVPELTRLASREAEKLSEHLVRELTRQLTPGPGPKPNLLVPAVKHPAAEPLPAEEPIPDMPFGKDAS